MRRWSKRKNGRRRHGEGFNALAIIFMLAVAAGIVWLMFGIFG